MDSDSDHFESADEEFQSDDEDAINKHSLPKEKLPLHQQKNNTDCEQHINETCNFNKEQNSSSVLHTAQLIENITLEDSTTETEINNSNVIEQNKSLSTKTETYDNNEQLDNKETETNANIIKNNVPEEKPKRRERPQKTREPKLKLGIKLGTKINSEKKNEAFWQAYTEAKKNEYAEPPKLVQCWEAPPPTLKDRGDSVNPDLYSEKSSTFNPEKNFWENEENYMELPQENKNVETTKQEDDDSSWGGWGNWGGMSSLLSTAQTITNSVSQSVTKVLETSIGIPDPEELAKQDRTIETIISRENSVEKDSEPSDEIPTKIDEQKQRSGSLGFGFGNLVSGVSHITKLVETTGTKVLSGGLDTLEVIGKKTMEVLQEGDPGLKKKRALFKINQNKPVLSQILREAKEKAEEEDKLSAGLAARKPHYETMFDDFQGLVHLEALEMLSKQCDIKLETLMETLTGSKLQDMQETMAQIKELCELPEDDDDISSVTEVDSVKEKMDSAISEININITYNHFIDTWRDINQWLQSPAELNENEINQKAIESLAQLTAIAVEQFHKAGELLLVKERRSTVDEADSLVQLTTTLTAVISLIAGKFSEKLNSRLSNSENINDLITNIFLEAANSSTYIKDAFNLMIPVLQVGAI